MRLASKEVLELDKLRGDLGSDSEGMWQVQLSLGEASGEVRIL